MNDDIEKSRDDLTHVDIPLSANSKSIKEVDNTSQQAILDISTDTCSDSVIDELEVLNPKDFHIDLNNNSNDETLYQKFVEKVNSIRNKPADSMRNKPADNTTTTLSEPNPTLNELSLTKYSMDISKKENFSPFTLNFLQYLKFDIEKNKI